MSDNNLKGSEKEIENIFNRARTKLDEIDENADEQKSNVVKELAIELEGKIALDTICIEIVTQLRDKVSERFVLSCLEAKYKQGYRIVNAKKQKIKGIILAAALVQLEKSELADALSKATKFPSAVEMLDLGSSTVLHSVEKIRSIKFFVDFGELREKMRSLKKRGDEGKLQFVVEFNTQTFEPLSVSIFEYNNQNGINPMPLRGGQLNVKAQD
jgi:hypothetical protein